MSDQFLKVICVDPTGKRIDSVTLDKRHRTVAGLKKIMQRRHCSFEMLIFEVTDENNHHGREHGKERSRRKFYWFLDRRTRMAVYTCFYQEVARKPYSIPLNLNAIVV